jgi:hypothetical protein
MLFYVINGFTISILICVIKLIRVFNDEEPSKSGL